MDFHFLIRNGIVGFIALAFFLVGVASVDPKLAACIAKATKDFATLINFAAAFLVGIIIQSGLILWHEWFKVRKLFADEARHVVANKVRSALREDNDLITDLRLSILQLQERGLVKKGFDAIEALLSQDSRSDPVFVALYHLKVPPHLVEWARRRRSYYYLGATSMIAITFGLMSGFLLGVMQSGFSPESPLVSWGSTWANHPLRWPLLAISAVIVSFFIISALWLANRMKNDADQMELAWALIECSDIARKKLGLKDK